MILADTSVWIDHIREGSPALLELMAQGRLLHHPFVTAELALGSLPDRSEFCTMLGRLPQAELLTTDHLLAFVAEFQLYGTGLGMVDAHLLATAHDRAGITVWSTDKRLLKQAERLGIAHDPG